MTVGELKEILKYIDDDLDVMTEEGDSYVGVLMSWDKSSNIVAMMEVE